MQQIMFIKEVLPMEQIQVTNQKTQRVRIINISPLWGHKEPADKAF